MNAVEIEEAVSKLAGQPFDREEFAYSFLEAYGNKQTTIKRLREGNSNKSKIEGGVLQRNNIHIATCAEGKVSDTLQQLHDSPETAQAKAKLILATDGIEFQAEDLNSGETVACRYKDFHEHFSFFFELAGISSVKEIRESTFDIKATGRLNKLYIELLRSNPEWATAERRQEMNHFFARLIFCFFAEDTNIFNGDNLFTGTVQRMSASDGSNIHEIMGELFRAMDTKVNEREVKGIRNWANTFPYVNGELFSGSTDCPKFTKIARSYLLHVGNLDWKQINPDIFGSMIQAVADEDERGSLGMHYTSVPNILKVLNPLFLDDLRNQLEEAGDNARKLLNLRKRIARIRVFDPACGSGNFLVIAYKQLREIENAINIRRGEPNRSSEIPLTNFRGIEIRGFSAEIARLALIIAEFQCDVLYLGQQLALAEFLPLDSENWITTGNALRINWLSVCPPTGTGVKLHGDDLFSTPLQQAEIDFENEGGETFICGNPPYIGRRNQDKDQKYDLKSLLGTKINSSASLDYVFGWIEKASDFISGQNADFAFVTTNSISQGTQVSIYWPHLLKKGFEINFAHRSFKWANNASHNAGVTCVIVGVGIPKKMKKIYEDEHVHQVTHINPYLLSGEIEIVSMKSKPISVIAKMNYGNLPGDGNHLSLNQEEKDALLVSYPEAAHLILPLFGAQEFIHGLQRYCLWIDNDQLDLAMSIPEIAKRIENVRKTRVQSKDPSYNKLASRPHQFRDRNLAEHTTILVPQVSSEAREYLPTTILKGRIGTTNQAFALYDVPLWNMSLIASKLHLVWVATVCGQLETRLRYSNTLGWNTFPLPTLTAKNKEDLTKCAEEILIARERHFPATIADLYEPEKMPDDLRRAHERNDEVLERIYIGRRFKNDTERLEKLFEMYTEMTSKEKVR
jgi:hypothetical protein